MATFIRIVDAGSITRASEQLNVAKSAISRRLSDLEGRLGIQLIIRTTRQSNLTEAGDDYYKRAVQILGEVDELNSALSKDDDQSLKGQLRISAPLSFGLKHLSPAILTFTNMHPNLNVHIDFIDRQIDLVEEGYDLAIRIAQLKDSSLIAKKLIPIKTILCASPVYLSRMGNPKNLIELAKHDGLIYSHSNSQGWQLFCNSKKAVSITPKQNIISNNGDFLKEAALQDRGITLLPTFLIVDELNDGRLVQILDNHTGIELNAYAVYPQTRHLPLKCRIFIDFLQDWLKKNYIYK